jgi:Protein of unknown function DUF262
VADLDLPEDQQEELEDLNESGQRYSAVVNQADWTVQTIIQQINKGNIELNPEFQRREAWRVERKSQYIESLILNVPVPQIVLAERKDRRGRFVVIDGKQRLMTLRQYWADDEDKKYKTYDLRGLTVRTELNKQSIRSLEANFPSDFDALENSTIRTAVIRNWRDENFLYSVFLRLNTGSVPLSPQELRQALHPGEFARFVNNYSMDCEILHRAMHLAGPDVRMRDAELVIRYFAFRNFLNSYSGSMKSILDETTKVFNADWEEQKLTIELQKVEFERAINSTIEIFGQKDAFRKWNGRGYEGALNRAVFDVIIFYFIDENVANAAEQRKEKVISAFKEVCLVNDFRTAIEGTTKSISALFNRLDLWGKYLAKAIEMELPVLNLRDNRIISS